MFLRPGAAAAAVLAAHHPVSVAAPPSDVPDEVTAYATVALAALTLLALVATILITRHGDRQQRQERREVADSVRLSDAYAIEVLGVARTTVINHGQFPVTNVQARLRLSDGTWVRFAPGLSARYPGTGPAVGRPPQPPDTDVQAAGTPDVLAPWDMCLRFALDPQSHNVADAYPAVRWTDRWGQPWEHRKGEVRRLDAAAAQNQDWGAW